MSVAEEIRAAICARQWMDFLSQYPLRDDADEDAMHDAAISLHNAGEIDLLAEIDELGDVEGSYRFYEIQSFYAKALPGIEAAPAAMLGAVRRLVEEGGPNRDGMFIALPFRQWCGGPGRAGAIAALLDFTMERDAWYLRLAIEGASAADADAALGWAMSLIDEGPALARNAALEAMGSLGGGDAGRSTHALRGLRTFAEQHEDDLSLALALFAAVELHGRNGGAGETDTAAIVDRAAQFGGSEMRMRVASALWFLWNTVAPAILDQLIAIAKTITGDERAAIANLDHALYQMGSGPQIDLAIDLVEALLAANHGTLSVHQFSSFEHQLLTKHRDRFERLAVLWFVSGRRGLGEAVMALVRKVHGAPMVLTVDLASFGFGAAELIFLARKAVGYLFAMPITAASLLLGVMRTGIPDAVNGATELLFDPLLVNYSGDLSEFLRNECQDSRDAATPHVTTALRQLDDYIAGLRAVGRVEALDPSERERTIEWRRRQQEMDEVWKQSEKDSIFSQLATKVAVLYGNRSIIYVEGPDGETRRLVNEMQSYSHTIEAARMTAVDPHGIDLVVRRFRVERLPT